MLRSASEREALRLSFQPAEVRVLFVGESPPASGRFFYSGNSGLYRAMRDAFCSVDPAVNDENFLEVFRDSGCYLIDLCAEPVDQIDSKSRKAAHVCGQAPLRRSIAELGPSMIVPLLVSIAEIVSRAASEAGWSGEIVPVKYPGRWVRHKAAFIETVAPMIARLRTV